MKKILIILLFLFGISSAWADSTVVSTCNSYREMDNWYYLEDSTYSIDGMYANFRGADDEIGAWGGYNGEIPEGDSIDSVRVGIPYYDADDEGPRIALGSIDDYTEYTDYQSIDVATSIDTVWTLFEDADITRDLVNGYLAVFFYPASFSNSNYTHVDGAIIVIFHHTPETCTLGIDSVTITQLSHAKAKVEGYIHCLSGNQADSIKVFYDSAASGGYLDSFKVTGAQADSTYLDTITGLWVDGFRYRMVVWDDAASDTLTGSWSQNWMVDTLTGVWSSWANDYSTHWIGDIGATAAGIANLDSFILTFSSSGYKDSSDASRLAVPDWDMFSDNQITLSAPDTIYMCVWAKRLVNSEVLWSPRYETLFVATYTSDTLTSVTLDTTGTGWRQSMIPDTVQFQLTTPNIAWPETLVYYYTMGANTGSDSLAANNRHAVVWQANHTFTIKDTIQLVQPDTLRVYVQYRDNILADGAWSTRQLRKIYWGGTTNAPPTDCRVTTYRSEQIDSTANGWVNPNTISPKQLVDWTPKFSMVNNLTNACSVYIDVGIAAGGATMWSYHTFISDTLAVGERTPKITYAGLTLQDGQTYHWRARTKSNTEASAWSDDNTFEGVDPAWWDTTYLYRANVRFGTDHSAYGTSFGLAHTLNLNRGFTKKVGTNGLSNEAVVALQMIYKGGWLYFAWNGITNDTTYKSTGTYQPLSGRFMIRGYNYTTEQWTDPETLFAIPPEVHYYPILFEAPDSSMWAIRPGHNDAPEFIKTRNAFVAGSGWDTDDWYGKLSVVCSTKTGVVYDSTVNWEHNAMQNWLVSACSTNGNPILTSTLIDSNTTNKIFFSGSAGVQAGGKYQAYKRIATIPSGATTLNSSYCIPIKIGSSVYVFFRGHNFEDMATAGGSGHYSYIRSTDGGQTWGNPKTIAMYFGPATASMYCAAYTTGDDGDSTVWVSGTYWWGYLYRNQGGRSSFVIKSKLDAATGEFINWYTVNDSFVGQSLDSNRVYQIGDGGDSRSLYAKIDTVRNDTIINIKDPGGRLYSPSALIKQILRIKHSKSYTEHRITGNDTTKIWVTGGYGFTPSVGDSFWVIDTMAIRYENTPTIMTCNDPYSTLGGSWADSSSIGGGDYLAAMNTQGCNVIHGMPIVNIQTFDDDTITDAPNNLLPGDIMEAYWVTSYNSSPRNEWYIDNLSGVTKFVSRTVGVHTAYTVTVKTDTIILNDGAGDVDTFATGNYKILREAVNHGLAGYNNNDSCHFAKIQYAGITFPNVKAATNFVGGTYRAYSSIELPAAKVYKTWNFRNAGASTVDGTDIWVFAGILPESTTWFGEDEYYWYGAGLDTNSLPTWTMKKLSYGSEFGCGRIYALPKAYLGIDKAICYSRGNDVLVSTDFQFSRLNPSGEDVALVYSTSAGAKTNKDRIATYWDAESTTVSFKLSGGLPANQNAYTNGVVQFYWGSPTPQTALQNPSNVVRWFEGFESGYNHNAVMGGVNGWSADVAVFRTFDYFDNVYSGSVYQAGLWTGGLYAGKFFAANTYRDGNANLTKTLSSTQYNCYISAYIMLTDSSGRGGIFLKGNTSDSNYVYLGVRADNRKGTWKSSWSTSWTDTGRVAIGTIGAVPNQHKLGVSFYTVGDTTTITGFINNIQMFSQKRYKNFTPTNGISKIGLFGEACSYYIDHIKIVDYVPNSADYNITSWEMRNQPSRRQAILKNEEE